MIQLGLNSKDVWANAFRRDPLDIAALLSLDKVIGEEGGIKIFGIDKTFAKLQELFSALKAGALTADEVGQEFDKVFAQLLPESINKTTGLVSKAFLDLQEQAIKSGISSPALDQFRQQQVGGVLGGIGTFLGVGNTAEAQRIADQQKLIELQKELATATGDDQARIRKEIDDTNKDYQNQIDLLTIVGLTSEASAQAIGAGILASFAELEREGLSVTQAIKQITPSVNALEQQLLRTGIDGGAAFEKLRSLVDMANDAVAGPALDAIGGLGDALKGLSNTGLLDQDTFNGLTRQIADTFNRLVSQGKDGDQALRLMQPTLQTIFSLQKDFGFQVDEATQNLLDQAEAMGIVGDKFRTPQQQMVDGIGTLNQLILALLDGLGIQVPEAARKAASGVKEALDSIPKLTELKVKITTVFDNSEGPGGIGGQGEKGGGWVILPFNGKFGPTGLPGLATGGLMLPNAIQRFAEGGRVLPFARPLRGFGADTELAALTPGEIVINAMQQGRLASALTDNGDGGGAVNEFHFYLDGRVLTDVVIERIARNKRSAGENMRKAVA
jgi:hypothetical protein